MAFQIDVKSEAMFQSDLIQVPGVLQGASLGVNHCVAALTGEITGTKNLH